MDLALQVLESAVSVSLFIFVCFKLGAAKSKSLSTGTVKAATSFKMPCSLQINSNIKFLLSDVTGPRVNRICCCVMALGNNLM